MDTTFAFLLLVAILVGVGAFIYQMGWRNFDPNRRAAMRPPSAVIEAVEGLCLAGSTVRSMARPIIENEGFFRYQGSKDPLPFLRGKLGGFAMEFHYSIVRIPRGKRHVYRLFMTWEFQLLHTAPNTLGLAPQHVLGAPPEMEVEDPEFDRRWVVRGSNPTWVRAVLDAEVREMFTRMREFTDSRMERGVEFKVLADGRAFFKHPALEVPAEMVEVVQSFAAIARAIDDRAETVKNPAALFGPGA